MATDAMTAMSNRRSFEPLADPDPLKAVTVYRVLFAPRSTGEWLSMLKFSSGLFVNAKLRHTWEMLFGVLLAGLGRLANLLPNNLPLIALVLLDGVEESLALLAVSDARSETSACA